MIFTRSLFVLALLSALSSSRWALAQTTSPLPVPTPTATPMPTPPPAPALRREMRGVWIATVDNIDWPSRAGLPVETQKAEMIELLDRSKALGLNAVFFQVRPSVDAFYDSKLEPWSEFLTGQMGRAPQPFYDPLAFTIEQAHARGLELHAWFNPYRARYGGAKAPASANHLSRTRPNLVKNYGKSQWLDPGEKTVQDYTTNVILDVVRRYDIDAVHFDDYFYPYVELDAQKQPIPFPDDPTWNLYQRNGGKLSRSDWRRDNVNTLVQRLSREIKAAKPWVRFGVSPFGIWRPGFPAQIKGLDAYEVLYADAQKWTVEGWIDYLVPQLYWKIEAPGQSFPVLLNWWTQQNPKKRHIWAGQYTDRATKTSPTMWPDEEVEYQIRTARGIDGASGTVHFSAKSLLRDDTEGLTKRLVQGVYREAVLVPASSWLPVAAPNKVLDFTVIPATDSLQLARAQILKPLFPGSAAWQWVVQTRVGMEWTSVVLPGAKNSFAVPNRSGAAPIEEIAVSLVDRLGNQSAPQLIKFLVPPTVATPPKAP